MNPKVSFVVPSYNLGHLLPDCVNSILSQTYKSLELIIMDDCSRDETPEVVKSFRDDRVRYVRNAENLGVCGNFNKGIESAGGDYIWIISADDRLRRDYAVERFVAFMDNEPKIGFAFCPTVDIEGGRETDIPKRMCHGAEDRVIRGHDFFRMLQKSYCLSASAMVRRECYQHLGMLPVDLDFAGDWYLWCVFCLYHDVGYIAEPMVNYRIHDLQTTSIMTRDVPHNCRNMSIAARWRAKEKAKMAGHESLVRACVEGISKEYTGRLTSKLRYDSTLGITLDEFEESLARHGTEGGENTQLRCHVYREAGDLYYSLNDFRRAIDCYSLVLQQRWDAKCWAKYALLSMGAMGIRMRRWISA